MIKLNCGVSRKIGEPNYGSRGASVNVELELESSAAQDANQLHDKIRRLFALAKSAVDEELGLGVQNGPPEPAQQPGHAPVVGQGSRSASVPPNGAQQAPRPATEPQRRAIRSLCARLDADPQVEAQRMYHRPLEELTVAEASRMIDELKGRANSGSQ